MNDEFDLTQVEWVKDTQRIHLEPGDVVVVRTQERLSEAIADYLKAKLQCIFPDNKVVVLDSDIEIGVLSADNQSKNPDGSL